MTTAEVFERHIKPLSEAEQLKLVEMVLAQRGQALPTEVKEEQRSGWSKRKWQEIAGKSAYPMVGQDAQNWVRDVRRESDEQREILAEKHL